MTEFIAVSANKGGVGKTSLVTNLAGVITKQLKKKVLIIDLDGQGNSSIAFGFNPNKFEHTIYDVLLGEKKAKDVIVKVEKYLDILPANKDMNFFELDILPNLQTYGDPFQLLSKAVKGIEKNYDYVLLDTPPSMGLVAGNVFAFVDKVIIPFVPERFAVDGLINVIGGVEDFKKAHNPKLQIFGIVGMMINSRTVLHSELLQQARQYCLEHDIKMFETVIPASIRFANATAYDSKPATWTDSNHHIVKSYYELLKEMM